MSTFLRTETGGPDDVIARVEHQIAAAQERAQRAREFEDDVQGVRGTATSSRGHVGATVDASGRLTDLALSTRAFELAPAQLSRLIVETSRAARQTAGARVLELAGQAFGAGSAVIDRLRSELEESAPPHRGTGRGLS